MEFTVLLLTLLQLQSYLVPYISARMFIIPKLRNIFWRKLISELSSLCIKHLPNCYYVRSSILHNPGLKPNFWSEHFSRALPTETIFRILRKIGSRRIILDYSVELRIDTLEIVIKWLQVSVCERN